MSVAESVLIATVFVWTGIVVGISFIEAPVKFRAPGVTVPIGLSIGRLVFKVVNSVEALLAAAVVAATAADRPGATVLTAVITAVVVLAAQLVAVRPRLTRRSNAVLAGEDAPRSHAHHAYVGLEVVKLVALLVAGVAALTAA